MAAGPYGVAVVSPYDDPPGSFGLNAPLPLSRTTVDRRADRRGDDAWLAEAWSDPRSRVLVVERGRTLVDAADRLVLLAPPEAPEGERYLLGVEEERAYFAVSAPLPEPGPNFRAADLREVGALLGDRDAGLLVHAVALQRWHATHRHCPRCGALTELRGAGHVRVCVEDGSEHFPRVDPAVIVLVREEGEPEELSEERCLLARKPDWPKRRLSVLAGFVEPGESLEQAVAREVAEEVGLRVTGARYAASQPWPFPSSLMLGFEALASGAGVAVDEAEIAEAYWFTRGERWRATEAEAVLLPPGASIARRLIEGWYGGPLRSRPGGP